jgi:nanoRNase/pAp phosphatase (c-di-AMP/oligoRNAs hydrolase)
VGGCRTASATSELSGGERAVAISLPGSIGGNVGWLVSMITASGRFRTEVIRIGGRVECDSMSLLGGGDSRESAANSNTSNVPPTHRK